MVTRKIEKPAGTVVGIPPVENAAPVNPKTTIIPHAPKQEDLTRLNKISPSGRKGKDSGLTTARRALTEQRGNSDVPLANQAVFNAVRNEYEHHSWKPHDFQPEYAQDLQHVSFYLSHDEESFIWRTQREIIKNLPPYTKIKIYLAKGSFHQGEFERGLPKEAFERITFIEMPDEPDGPSPWAQDYTEGDHEVQILPLTYTGEGPSNMVAHPKNEFIDNLEKAGIKIRRAPVEFAGGNVFIAKDGHGEKILLVGGDAYLKTLRTYENCGETISENEFKEIMATVFQVQDVEILATRTPEGEIQDQNQSIFHLDQSMLPIDDGVVAMPVLRLEPPDKTVEEIKQHEERQLVDLFKKYGLVFNPAKKDNESPERARLTREQQMSLLNEQDHIRTMALQEINAVTDYPALVETKKELDHFRDLMESRGFKIVDLKVDPNNILNFQAYTNSLVYRDKTTGRKTILMPVFPDENGDYEVEGLNLENKRAYEEAGYEVKTVPDNAYRNMGNLHCLTILATSELKSSPPYQKS